MQKLAETLRLVLLGGRGPLYETLLAKEKLRELKLMFLEQPESGDYKQVFKNSL
jgi:hypothetical protein